MINKGLEQVLKAKDDDKRAKKLANLRKDFDRRSRLPRGTAERALRAVVAYARWAQYAGVAPGSFAAAAAATPTAHLQLLRERVAVHFSEANIARIVNMLAERKKANKQARATDGAKDEDEVDEGEGEDESEDESDEEDRAELRTCERSLAQLLRPDVPYARVLATLEQQQLLYNGVSDRQQLLLRHLVLLVHMMAAEPPHHTELTLIGTQAASGKIYEACGLQPTMFDVDFGELLGNGACGAACVSLLTACHAQDRRKL